MDSQGNVIPAKAGIQAVGAGFWMPAYAGMTENYPSELN